MQTGGDVGIESDQQGQEHLAEETVHDDDGNEDQILGQRPQLAEVGEERLEEGYFENCAPCFFYNLLLFLVWGGLEFVLRTGLSTTINLNSLV